MEDWIQLTFCHFNDYRNLVDAWKEDPTIIQRKMGARRETILHRAALRTRREMVEFLLEQGVVQEEDSNGNLPLHCAALGGDTTITRLLIHHGADLETRNHEGDTPLHLAAAAGNIGVLRELLQAGASLESRGRLGNLALHSAAENAQVEIMQDLLQRGVKTDQTNIKGEYPIHLAAGATATHGDMRHVEVLLQYGSNLKRERTEEGCTAAHYAASTGPAEVLQLLLDAGCPLTKATMNSQLRWCSVIQGESLLQSVASSCDERKGSLLLERIMEARYKQFHTRSLQYTDSPSQPWSYMELSSQEMELSAMYNELECGSPVLQSFLHNCPESVKCLLDSCIMSDDNSRKVKFDFFLFRPLDSRESDLAIIDLVIATGRNKLLEHPLFETFIQLKWQQMWKLYFVLFLFHTIHQVIITIFTLTCFSSFQSLNASFHHVIFYLMLTSNILLTCLQLAKVYCAYHHTNTKPAIAVSNLSNWVTRRERFYPLLDFLIPILGFLVLFTKNREITGLLVLYSSWQFMRILTVFPRVGKNIFISTQVTSTILEFFLSYIIELFAFTLTFHILLPNTSIFSNIGDSFIKVVTMLLGEFEFEDLNENDNVSWMAKIVFLLFVMLMSIVLINLVIGLSINDVTTLRKDAHIHKLINTVSAIRSVEKLKESCCGLVGCGSKKSTHRDCSVMDQVYLEMSHLDFNNNNYLNVYKPGCPTTLLPCPRTVLRAVSALLVDRRERRLAYKPYSKERRELLENVKAKEEEFFEYAIKSFL